MKQLIFEEFPNGSMERGALVIMSRMMPPRDPDEDDDDDEEEEEDEDEDEPAVVREPDED